MDEPRTRSGRDAARRARASPHPHLRSNARRTIQDALGRIASVHDIPIPLDCTDGFNEAYYGRPERLLDDGARLACSAWSLVPDETRDAYVEHLRRDLQDGAWD